MTRHLFPSFLYRRLDHLDRRIEQALMQLEFIRERQARMEQTLENLLTALQDVAELEQRRYNR